MCKIVCTRNNKILQRHHRKKTYLNVYGWEGNIVETPFRPAVSYRLSRIPCLSFPEQKCFIAWHLRTGGGGGVPSRGQRSGGGGQQQGLWEWLEGDTERISVYVDNHKSHLSTLERVLTNVEEGGKVRKYLEEGRPWRSSG